MILHADTSQERFDAARELLSFAFANYTLAAPEVGELPSVPVRLGRQGSVGAACPGLGRVLLRKTELNTLEARVDLPERVDAPVEAGERLGTLVITAGGAVAAELPLVAAETVESLGLGGIWLSLVRILCGHSREEIFSAAGG